MFKKDKAKDRVVAEAGGGGGGNVVKRTVQFLPDLRGFRKPNQSNTGSNNNDLKNKKNCSNNNNESNENKSASPPQQQSVDKVDGRGVYNSSTPSTSSRLHKLFHSKTPSSSPGDSPNRPGNSQTRPDNSQTRPDNSQTRPSNSQTRPGNSSTSPETKDVQNQSGMEVGVASYTQGGPVGSSPDRGGARSSPRGNLHVEFAQVGEMKERKEKYLTAKYGAHQMSLIRKRLGVEMWMFDQLQTLYPPQAEGKHEEKEVDLDELLDVEDDLKKKRFLREVLSDCKQTPDKIEKFIDELLEKAKTL